MKEAEYHFIGIGGIGMSGLARMLLEKNKKVSGSDQGISLATQDLIQQGASVYHGHKYEQVPDGAIVVYSTDISDDNPELIAAKEKKCTILHRSDLLLSLMQDKTILAVAGTHGKTTTTALLTHLFRTANLEPTFAVGGMMHNGTINAATGNGQHFIVEADESDGTFLKYPYGAAIVTNIDTDHLAHYGNWEALVEAFKTFLLQTKDPDFLFYCHDDNTLSKLGATGISYGFSEGAKLFAHSFSQKGFQIQYDIEFEGVHYKEVVVSLTGRHNALNSLAVFGLAIRCGIDEQIIRKAFSTFSGVQRRLEKKGEKGSIIFFDDYAHHPTEIQATLKALRGAVGKRRIVAIFQPHRYSRMRFLLKNFAQTFDDADLIIITDLYTAKEAAVPQVTSESIYQEIKRHYPNSLFVQRQGLEENVISLLEEGDVIITMGAGDITKAGVEICRKI